jgi:outer membrane murein-binding lipoprotein Lpp
MSNTGGYERLTVDSDGVRVTKRFERDEFPVPAIAFEFESERDRAVRIRLEDRVPEGVAVEDLGFHPEYGSEYWTVDGETIAFERELSAGSEYTTVYGIRATGTEEIERFLTEPAVTTIDQSGTDSGTAPSEESIVPGSDDVARDASSGSGDGRGVDGETGDPVPDATEDTDEGAADPEEADGEIATLDLRDPDENAGKPGDGGTTASGGPGTATGAATGTTGGASSGTVGDGTTGSDDAGTGDPANRSSDGPIDGAAPEATDDRSVADSGRDGALVSALAAEIRNGDVASEDLELIEAALDRAGKTGATEARIERLQSDIADLRAYTDALETFLDENGTAEQVIGEFEERLDNLADELAILRADLDANRTTTEELADTVTSVHDGVDDLTSDVDGIRGDVAAVESTVSDLEGAVEELRADVDRLETEGDVSERLDGIESDLAALQEWREQIQQTFGG